MNKKKKIQLIIVLLLLVVLVAVFLFLKKNEDADFMQEEIPTQEEQITVTSIDKTQVTEIEFICGDESFTLQKDGENWSFAKEDTQADTANVSIFLDSLCDLTAMQEIPDAEKLEDYGIDEESDSITLQLADDLYVFRLGDYNSLSTGYYITMNDTGTVYLVDSTTYNQMKKDHSYFEAISEEAEDS